ncbi:MAG: hypothetical protein ACOY9Y_10420 [Bacillota bacterium]
MKAVLLLIGFGLPISVIIADSKALRDINLSLEAVLRLGIYGVILGLYVLIFFYCYKQYHKWRNPVFKYGLIALGIWFGQLFINRLWPAELKVLYWYHHLLTWLSILAKLAIPALILYAAVTYRENNEKPPL